MILLEAAGLILVLAIVATGVFLYLKAEHDDLERSVGDRENG